MKTYEPLTGEDVSKTAKRMVALAKKTKETVTAKFKDIVLTAKPGDNPDTIAEYYSEKYYQIKLNCRHEEYAKKKRQREAEEAQRRQDLMLTAFAAAPKKMTLRDKKEWKDIVAASPDGYNDRVIIFVERWARLMEGRMANGDTLETCAEETSLLANKKGIPGFAYRLAVYILVRVWVHGKQLCNWYNLTQG